MAHKNRSKYPALVRVQHARVECLPRARDSGATLSTCQCFMYSRVVLVRSGPGRDDRDAMIARGGKFVRHPGILSKSDVISARCYYLNLGRHYLLVFVT